MYALSDEIDRWIRTRVSTPAVAPLLMADIRTPLVGRTEELRRLSEWLGAAASGTRQIVLVTGDLGIGKTALAHAFLEALACEAFVSEGSCVEQYGSSEPYLPIIDALSQLARRDASGTVLDTLRRHAPAWQAQFDTGIVAADRNVGPYEHRDRPARELAHAIEALASLKPLVLVIEDLHWSDPSTTQLIAWLARRREPLRLLLIGTARSADPDPQYQHFWTAFQEMRAHRLCHELALNRLSESDVAAYLETRGPWRDVATIARLLFRHTEGTPLFLVRLVDHLVEANALAERDGCCVLDPAVSAAMPVVPTTLRSLIAGEVDRLAPDERRILDIGSLASAEFTAAAVAHAGGGSADAVERTLDRLVRRHLLERRGTLDCTDGTISDRFAFAHQFYRQVVHGWVSPGTRIELHRRLAEWCERALDTTRGEVASEIAMHFDAGREFAKAAGYHEIAADNALRRNADAEAELTLRRALASLERGPLDREREWQHLRLLLKLAAALTNRHGMADLAVQAAYDDALAVAGRLPDAPELLQALLGVARIHYMTGDIRRSGELTARAVSIARTQHPGWLAAALSHHATTLLHYGDFERAQDTAREALDVHGADDLSIQGVDTETACLNILAWSAWFAGDVERSLEAGRRQLARASASGHPLTLAFACAWTAPLMEWAADEARSRDLLETAGRLAASLERRELHCWCECAMGWVLARRGKTTEGLAMLRTSIDEQRAGGLAGFLPWEFVWYAEALLLAGDPVMAGQIVDEALALARRTGNRCTEAELHRLKAASLLAAGAADDRTEAELRAGLEIAAVQRAGWLELRLAIATARLLMAARPCDAAAVLDPLCTREKGIGTRELSEARELLSRLKP